ncbi:2-oxo-4-hydroxy-4-carboxy-5-ureidoimidazoline decarboxylase [Gracilibacillus oryzae]|uniref:2-oxo-4-hydroxy-4-carboxy-5-ureidoimidazoline decarboxylase n=1 Tax=Gracilibacillus oryzae TaxID=1672701 RepID=A0A7C8GUG7_9BACI|nr:2-oxo-4-hydroxy-4-carboxy-5-ureidoimidazoline decarboxylase [Gracilibacillus oryzae]KAB8138213.1 2-oxo-4-hydroxy-4-carboxy-5-ureidoimidazoline decarboxylase [Gracilibacillus oryzae]
MYVNDLNKMDETEFVDQLGSIFEQSPWIAQKALRYRPYTSLEDLYQRMCEIVHNATEAEKLELIRSHPNLGERVKMSQESVNEQTSAGLKNLTKEEYDNFHLLNQRYIDKFQFPFIFAVKGKKKTDIMQAMLLRVEEEETKEFQTALSEIFKIAKFRLDEKFNSHFIC